MGARPLVPDNAAGLVPLPALLGGGTERERAAPRIVRLVDPPDEHGWVVLLGISA